MKLACLASVLAFTLLAATAASATTAPLPAGTTAVPLAVITNDRDASVSQLKLMVNGAADVSGIYMETSANASSNPTEAQVFPLADIETGDGVVLGEGQGVKAIFLRGTIASAQGQGSLTIRYLANGVFRHWSECKIGLKKLGPHDWQLVNAYDGQAIQQIKVETWSLGISTLENVCPAKPA